MEAPNTRWVDMQRSLKDWVAAEAPRTEPPRPPKQPAPIAIPLYQGHAR